MPRRRRPTRQLRHYLALAIAMLVAGCTSTPHPALESSATPPPLPHTELRVLAGSELADIQPLLPELSTATGVKLKLDYKGTLAATEQLAGDRGPYDLAWLSSDRYLDLLLTDAKKERPQHQKIMLSPVAVGVKHSVATRLGWAGGTPVTWAMIADRAKTGEFHYGMSDPAESNTGLAALIGVATAASGTGAALRHEDIDRAIGSGQLQGFFAGQALWSDNSHWLAEAYVRDQGRLDGMVNYESVILSLNAGGTLSEPLDLVYPQEGIVTADYPLVLLNTAQRTAYDRVVDWLRSEPIQQKLMSQTGRRPVNQNVRLEPRFPASIGVEVAFPGQRSVIDELLQAYQDRLRKSAHVVYLLDFSRSMRGGRVAALRSVFASLSGADTSLTGQFSRFRKREEITIMRFGGRILDERDFVINGQPDLAAINDYVGVDFFDENTAIWSSLDHAYQKVADIVKTHPGKFVSVVLMTDGENNAGIGLDEFLADYRATPPEVRAVRTYTIRLGEADPNELSRAAKETGGHLFDANATSLLETFREIRGNQ